MLWSVAKTFNCIQYKANTTYRGSIASDNRDKDMTNGKLNPHDLLIVKHPEDEFEEYVKKQVQIHSKFEDGALDLYFDALETGKQLLKEEN